MFKHKCRILISAFTIHVYMITLHNSLQMELGNSYVHIVHNIYVHYILATYPVLLFLQEIENGMWHVDSISGTTPEGYTITRCQMATCKHCISEGSTCTATECNCLCIHMYKCDSKCYSFNNGHICKHIHRVHLILQKKQPQDQQAEYTVQEDLGQQQCEIAENTEHPSLVYADSGSDPQRGTHVNSHKYIHNTCTHLLYF